ncbi:MAG TPA: response regulator [Burkholderiales bacterium]|nr:response regulator [Burkholderiales bacterium]
MSALRKVLVVDDDPVVGKSFNRVLSNKGYIVVTAHDGPEALKRLAESEYDVVFTDIRMPGMDGIEVAERVKAKRPWTPVVIVTGYGSEDNEARAKAAGVAEFLHKPLSPEMIEGSARKALHVVPAPVAAVPRETVIVPTPKPASSEAARPGAVLRALEAIAMLVVGPVVALAYIVAAPFVGLAMLAWMGIEAMTRTGIGRYVRNVAMMLAAPFVGLAYVIAMPFIGLGTLVWMGVRALHERGAFARAGRRLRNVALFLAAPFIGLAYVMAFPFIGVYLLVTGAMKKGDHAE